MRSISKSRMSTCTLGNKSSEHARHTSDGKKLIVDLGSRLQAGDAGTLEVAYRIQEPKDGLHFFSPSKSDPDAPLLVWSQGETTTNRYWFPCIDEPDQRQTTEVVVTVPEGFEAVSNGKLVERQDNPTDKTVTFDWRQEIPHPSYLVTLVVGEFDVVRHEWEGIPVLYYVPKGHQAEAEPTYGRTPEMLSYFSERFGVRYPWAKYAQVSCFQFGGGMENTSATTMGDRILLDKRSLLDRNSESIVSHELAHQWWGDMVTCRDWSHTWLNEGFASYAEALWDEHARGRDEYAFNMDRKAGRAICGRQGATGHGSALHQPRRHVRRPLLSQRRLDRPHAAQSVGRRRILEGHQALRHRQPISQRGIVRFAPVAGTRDRPRPGAVLLRLGGTARQSRRRGDHRISAGLASGPADRQTDPGRRAVRVSAQDRADLRRRERAGRFGRNDEREGTQFRLPLPGPLERIDVDPDQAILTELKETKDSALWRAQLLDSPSVTARLRAARHFAESKLPEDHELLAQAAARRTILGSQVGTDHGPRQGERQSRQGSAREESEGVRRADSKSRRGCAGKLGPDAELAAVLKEMLSKGDPSYAVEGSMLAAYGRQHQKDAVTVITPWLSKESFQDTLADAALSALAATEDPAVLDSLLNWAKPEKPRERRAAALRGLSELAKSKRLSDEQRKEIVKPLLAALEV